MTDFIQIVSSTIGTLGFALFFYVRKDRLIPVTIGGFLTICLYILSTKLGAGLFLGSFIASIGITTYSEVLARIYKCPATVFLFPGVIPLAPGGSLFYTMDSAIKGLQKDAQYYASNTFQVALGIAVGVIVISVIVRHINSILYKRKNKKPC